MHKVKVSIIIPVYNTERYLLKCIESVISQTFSNIEIICINDGSTDKSLEILNDYAQKDNRIIVLSQENSKQGAARNRGLEIAKGEYITFVDSDDWIEKNYIELLYNAAITDNVNIAAASMTRDKDGKEKRHLTLKNQQKYFGANDIVKAIDNHFETAGKLYKFELIKDLRFMEGVFYEDAPYTIRAIHSCSSMVTVPNAHYHYVSHKGSTIKQQNNYVEDKIKTSLDLVNYAEENNIEIKDWVIYKENHFLWAIKHYKYHDDLYILGVKVWTKKIKKYI